MPMFLFRRNVHDISYADHLLIRFGSDNTFARSDKQHLIAAMDVHFVPRTGAEIDNGKIKVVAHLRRQQRLSRHRTAREQGTIRWFRGDRVGFDYLHGSILLLVSGSLRTLALDARIPHSLVSSSIPRGGKNFQPRVEASSKFDISRPYQIGSAPKWRSRASPLSLHRIGIFNRL